jgi:hypothetical protein
MDGGACTKDQLYLVRHELEMLLFTRATWGFSEVEDARYHELCNAEQRLLALACAA